MPSMRNKDSASDLTYHQMIVEFNVVSKKCVLGTILQHWIGVLYR